MDYKAFAAMVEEEIAYLTDFDVTRDPDDCKALAALYELRAYIPRRIQLEEDIKHLMENEMHDHAG